MIGAALNNPEQKEVKTLVKKQEEAVGANEEEETVEQCMARVKEENPEMTDEAARAQCTKEPEPEATAEKTLKGQILAVMQEYGKTLADQVRLDIKRDLQKAVDETREQFVGELRKGLGIEKDPVLHLSEIEDIVRKMVLEEKPHGKRTETITKEKPLEGGEEKPRKLLSAEDRFKELTKNRTMI